VILVERGAADVSGALTARFDARDPAYLVRRFLVQGPDGAEARIYVGEPSQLNLADGTRAGELDIADYAQPLYVPRGIPLVVIWTDSAGRDIDDPNRLAVVRAEIEEL